MKSVPESRRIIDIALKAGKILLTSGAEIYRVEDTITRICESYGVICESFVLPSGIFVSIKRPGHESFSEIMRVRGRAVNLYRIELVNTFSRSLKREPISYERAIKVLDDIENTPHFKFPARLLAAATSALIFTLLFKGKVTEGLAAACTCMLVYFIKEKISEIGFFEFLEFFVSGMNAALISVLFVRLFPQLNIYKIIIGAIVIFLPGVAITNSINDALHGDIVSSLSGMGETVLIVTALGVGVGIVLIVGMQWVW